MSSRIYKKLARARNYMCDTYQHPIKLADISAEANLSPYHFQRTYKKSYGETPHEFLTRLRIDKAKTLLSKGNHSVTDACFEVGFSSLGSFSSLFVKQVGLSPSEYQRCSRSTHWIQHPVHSLFIPSCFFSMVYGGN